VLCVLQIQKTVLLTAEVFRDAGTIFLWLYYVLGLIFTHNPFFRATTFAGHAFTIALLFTAGSLSNRNSILALSLIPSVAGLHELIFNVGYVVSRIGQHGDWSSLFINWSMVFILLLPIIVLKQIRYAWKYLVSFYALPLYFYLAIWILQGMPVSIDQLTGIHTNDWYVNAREVLYSIIFAVTWYIFRWERDDDEAEAEYRLSPQV